MKRFSIIISIISLSLLLISCTKKVFIVSFDSDGGSLVPTQEVANKSYAVLPTDEPTKSGYDFLYWSLNNEEFIFTEVKITSDLTLKAIWEEKIVVETKFTVKFNSNGGTTISPQIIIEGNKALRPSNPTKDDYLFIEWQLNGVKFNFNDVIKADITLIAKWEEITSETTTFKVDFDSNGGTTIMSETVLKNQSVNKPADPTKTNYKFIEWRLNGAKYDFSTPITKNIILIAYYEEIEEEFKELDLVSALVAIMGFDREIISNTKYEAAITYIENDNNSQIIKAKIDLNDNYALRNSHIQVINDDNLELELYVIDGKYYIDDKNSSRKMKTYDVITDEFLGIMLGLANPFETLNYYYNDLIANLDFLNNIDLSNLKVYKKGNEYKLELIINVDAINNDNVDTRFMDDIKLEVNVKNNKVHELKVNFNSLLHEVNEISINISDFDTSFINDVDVESFDYYNNKDYKFIIDYGYNNIIQEITIDSDGRSFYDQFLDDMLAFNRNGYELAGIYLDPSFNNEIGFADEEAYNEMIEKGELKFYLKWEELKDLSNIFGLFDQKESYVALDFMSYYGNEKSGIYKLNELFVIVGMYENFNDYAVAYNIETEKTYLIYLQGENYVAVEHENQNKITQLLSDFIKAGKNPFMKIGDTYFSNDLNIVINKNNVSFDKSKYGLSYGDLKVNDYEEKDFIDLYNKFNSTIENNLIDLKLEYEDIQVYAENSYFSNGSILILDKNKLLNDIKLRIDYSNKLSEEVSLSEIDSALYELIYDYNDELSVVNFKLIIGDFICEFKGLIYDYDKYGTVVIENEEYYYLNALEKIDEFLEFLLYKGIKVVNYFEDYHKFFESLSELKKNVSNNNIKVINLEYQFNLKDFTFFKKAIDETNNFKIYYRSSINNYIYYNNVEDIFYNDNIIISFADERFKIISEKFMMDLPLYNLNINAVLEALPVNLSDYLNRIMFREMMEIRDLLSNKFEGELIPDFNGGYLILSGNQKHYLSFNSKKQFNYKEFNIEFKNKDVERTEIATQGEDYVISNNINNDKIYLKFYDNDITIYGIYNYAPEGYSFENFTVNGVWIDNRYFNLSSLSFEITANYEENYIIEMYLSNDYIYYDENTQKGVYLVEEGKELENFKISYIDNHYNYVTMNIMDLEEFDYEITNYHNNIYILKIEYKTVVTEEYIYIRKTSDEKLVIVNDSLYTTNEIGSSIITNELLYVDSLYDQKTNEKFNTVDELINYFENDSKQIFIVQMSTRFKQNNEILEILSNQTILFSSYLFDDFYINMSEKRIYNDSFSYLINNNKVIYENNSIKYEFPLETFNYDSFKDLITEDEEQIISLGKTFFDITNKKYDNFNHRGYSIQYTFEDKDVQFSANRNEISIYINTQYYSYRLDYESIDSTIEPKFNAKLYEYTIYNNINDDVIKINGNEVDQFNYAIVDYELEGIYDNSNFSGEKIVIPSEDATLYFKYIELTIVDIKIIIEQNIISIDNITDEIVIEFIYSNNSVIRARLVDIALSDYEIAVELNDVINESRIFIKIGDLETTIKTPIYDKTKDIVLVESYWDYGNKYKYTYLNKFIEYLPAYLEIDRVWSSELGNFENFLDFLETAMLMGYEIINVDLSYKIFDLDELIENVNKELIIFNYNNYDIIYDYKNNIISSKYFTFKSDDEYVYYNSVDFSAKVPVKNFDLILFLSLLNSEF